METDNAAAERQDAVDEDEPKTDGHQNNTDANKRSSEEMIDEG